MTPPRRARCVAYQSFVNGVFVLTGSLAGGYTAQHLPATITIAGGMVALRSPLLWVFAISGVMRLTAAAVFLPGFREVRDGIDRSVTVS